MPNKPGPVSRLLRERSATSHLLRQIERQRQLLGQVRSLLPAPLATHCLHARIDGRTLILHVDSPVWHSRLRFHARSLVNALRSEAPHLSEVRIRTLPPQSRNAATPPPPRRTAPPFDELIAGEELKRLLRRLRRRRNARTSRA